jgi:para-nitrobenzyl esterase
MPLLVGCLANEGHMLIPLNQSLTHEQFDDYLLGNFGGGESQVQAIKAAYVEEIQQSPGIAQHAIATDLFMASSMRQWASFNSATDQPTFLYFMDHVPPASRIYLPNTAQLELPDGPRSAGAYHSGDLAYVFNNLDKAGANWLPVDYQLAELMSGYWANFARNGNPNGDDLPFWLAYHPQGHSTMLLNATARSSMGIRLAKLDALQAAV